MKKGAIVNLLLLVISLSIAIIGAEFILRKLIFSDNEAFKSLKNPSYYAVYPSDSHEDFFNEDYWKLNYLFFKGFNVKDPHALLGWAGFFDKDTYKHWYDANSNGKRPVLFFGDSFAMCIDSVECFEDYLNNDSVFSENHFLFNYGVGGYGLDQIYLLYKEVVERYDNPYIVFSMLTTDLDRSMLKVRDAQKPYFEMNNGELELKGTPITMTSEEYFENNPPQITSYLFNRIINAGLKLFMVSEKERLNYIDNIKELNGKILTEVFDDMKKRNLDYTVVLFQPAWHSSEEWRLDFLKNICEENGVTYISDTDIRNKVVESGKANASDLYIPNDGHPTSLANRLISDQIKEQVIKGKKNL